MRTSGYTHSTGWVDGLLSWDDSLQSFRSRRGRVACSGVGHWLKRKAREQMERDKQQAIEAAVKKALDGARFGLFGVKPTGNKKD